MSKKNPEEKKLAEQVDHLKNQLKRALADYQNLEKRIKKERGQVVKFANEMLLVQLTSVLDGFEMVMHQFKDLLRQGGFERVEIKKGDLFDPGLMEAIGGEGKQVAEVLSAAYKLHDKIVKPARVRVGK